MFLVFFIFCDETFVHCVGCLVQCTNVNDQYHPLAAFPPGIMLPLPTDSEPVWDVQPSECFEKSKNLFPLLYV
jgi:hypothetical protein